MKVDFVEIAAVGLKVLIAAAGSVALYLGIKEICKSSENEKKPVFEDHDDNREGRDYGQSDVVDEFTPMTKRSRRIMNGLQIATAVCTGVAVVINAFSGISRSIDRLFGKSADVQDRNPYYMGDPGYLAGNYPWNIPESNGPYNIPIYRGKDSRSDDIYWIRRPNGITEVW